MTLGERIRERRKACGKTLEELAAEVNVSFGILARIERGVKDPSIALGNEIAKALGCTLAELLEDRTA